MHRGEGCPTDRPTESLDRRRVPAQGDSTPGGGDRLRFRVAKSQADVELVLPLASELHEDSRFAEIPFSQNKCPRGLNGTVRWAKARRAREIMIHVTSGADIRRTDRFLRRAGFVTIGANYALRLAGEGRFCNFNKIDFSQIPEKALKPERNERCQVMLTTTT